MSTLTFEELTQHMIRVNLGPLILGIFVNTYLYGVVTFQYAKYWATAFNDPLWIKMTVFMLFVLDTVHSSSMIWMAWVYAIEGFGNLGALITSIWPYPLTIMVTSVTAFVTQLFIAYRTYRLTKQLALYIGSVAVALGTFALGTVTCVKAFQTLHYTQLGKLTPYLSAWLCMELVTDVIICAALLITLWRARTGFSKSDTILQRLMRAAIQTGTCAGIFALLTAILYLAKPGTQFYCIPGLAISRVYTNTLMDTILCRGELRGMVEGKGEASQNALVPLGTSRSLAQLHIQKEVRTDVHYERNSIYSIRKMPQPVTSQGPPSPEESARDTKWKEQWGDRSTIQELSADIRQV